VLVGAKKPAPRLITRTVTLQFLTDITGEKELGKLAEGLKPLLSGHPGCGIAVIEKANTLLITDLPDNVEKISVLVEQLDQQTPQIKIEARIVEVKDVYQKELGIQWGAGFTADAAHGNALAYQFPNSLSIKGTTGEGGNYLVNLPAANPVAGVGLAMGHIANTLALDLRLSAMEKLEKLKIISTPSILALQNREATIKVGEQIPIQTTSTETSGRSTTEISFKDIVLQLKVLPYVTPDGRIFMTVSLNKDTRGEKIISTSGETNFAIDTKLVSTRVMLRDGETAVIGGLYTQQNISGAGQVPWLSRLPLLGWLFRSKVQDNIRSELLVFLTPRLQKI
jgi:type IV pilus assembly protein PilQ